MLKGQEGKRCTNGKHATRFPFWRERGTIWFIRWWKVECCMLGDRKACWCMQYFCFIWKSHVQHPPPCASAGGTPTWHVEVKAPTYIRSGCTDLRASSSHRPWAEGSSLYVGIQESMQMFWVLLICWEAPQHSGLIVYYAGTFSFCGLLGHYHFWIIFCVIRYSYSCCAAGDYVLLSYSPLMRRPLPESGSTVFRKTSQKSTWHYKAMHANIMESLRAIGSLKTEQYSEQ